MRHIFIGMLIFLLAPMLAFAQAPDGEEYIVQADDWLSKIADKEYGDPLAFPAIVEATNAKAAEDDSYSVIEDANAIEAGQKLWLPTEVTGSESRAPDAPMMMEPTGIYKAFLPGASSPGLEYTLYLNVDNSARWVSDYLNEEPPIVEIGSWSQDDDLVTVTLQGREDGTVYDAPVVNTLSIGEDQLVLVPDSESDEFVGESYYPIERLAREQAIPYDAAEAQQYITENGFTGYYKAFAPAASSPGRDITLLLGIEDRAMLETDFLTENPPITESGTWEAAPNAVTVTLEDSTLNFELVDGTLQSNDEQFGSAGLTLYLYPVIVRNSFPPFMSDVGETPDNITLEELRNATYTGIYEEPVTLTNGSYEGEPFIEDSPLRPRLNFVSNSARFGNLDDDEADEAVVLLTENSGGSGTFTYLAVMNNENGQPVNVSNTLLGDRVQVRSLEIQEGQIIVDLITQGPDEPLCCGSLKLRAVYELQNGELVELAAEEQGTISLADLEGTGWRLVDLDFEGDPVLPDTEITAFFQEGTIGGDAGCNQYSADLTNEERNLLTVAPPISTQMACPDPILQQEDAYLSRLADVTQFGYIAGQLSLIYIDEKGNAGSLIFQPLVP